MDEAQILQVLNAAVAELVRIQVEKQVQAVAS